MQSFSFLKLYLGKVNSKEFKNLMVREINKEECPQTCGNGLTSLLTTHSFFAFQMGIEIFCLWQHLDMSNHIKLFWDGGIVKHFAATGCVKCILNFLLLIAARKMHQDMTIHIF